MDCIAKIHTAFVVLGACQEIFKDRVEELRKAVQATEKNRQAAMRALTEERQRNLELQVKISRQVLAGNFLNVSNLRISIHGW